MIVMSSDRFFAWPDDPTEESPRRLSKVFDEIYGCEGDGDVKFSSKFLMGK